jgi:hypothetical protein
VPCAIDQAGLNILGFCPECSESMEDARAEAEEEEERSRRAGSPRGRSCSG